VARTAATVANVTGSVGVVSNRKLSMTRVAMAAAPRPSTVPMAIGHAASATIRRTT